MHCIFDPQQPKSFSEFRSIFQNLWAKWYFLSFHFCSCDVISPSFAYQDGGLHITSFLTFNVNILRTRSDIEKRLNGVLSYFVRSYTREQHFLWVNFPFKMGNILLKHPVWLSMFYDIQNQYHFQKLTLQVFVLRQWPFRIVSMFLL